MPGYRRAPCWSCPCCSCSSRSFPSAGAIGSPSGPGRSDASASCRPSSALWWWCRSSSLTVWPAFLPAAWGWLAILEGVLAAVWWVMAWALSRRDGRKAKDKGAPAPDRLERNRLSRWLSVSLWTAVSLAVFATIDSAGRTLAVGLQTGRIIAVLAPTFTVALGAFGIVQKLRPMLESVGGSKRLSLPAPAPPRGAGLRGLRRGAGRSGHLDPSAGTERPVVSAGLRGGPHRLPSRGRFRSSTSLPRTPSTRPV